MAEHVEIKPALIEGYEWWIYRYGATTTMILRPKGWGEAGKETDAPNVICRDPNKHDAHKQALMYGQHDFVCNEELDHPVARKEWPDYYMGKNRKGPRPFRSMVERREYLRRYGFGEA